MRGCADCRTVPVDGTAHLTAVPAVARTDPQERAFLPSAPNPAEIRVRCDKWIVISIVPDAARQQVADPSRDDVPDSDNGQSGRAQCCDGIPGAGRAAGAVAGSGLTPKSTPRLQCSQPTATSVDGLLACKVTICHPVRRPAPEGETAGARWASLTLGRRRRAHASPSMGCWAAKAYGEPSVPPARLLVREEVPQRAVQAQPRGGWSGLVGPVRSGGQRAARGR